jgi:hypothetical protein
MTEEEKKKFTHLEKRLVANVDFDDQALQVGFSYIYFLHVGTPRLGAILQRSVSKHPQGIYLGNSYDHGTYP